MKIKMTVTQSYMRLALRKPHSLEATCHFSQDEEDKIQVLIVVTEQKSLIILGESRLRKLLGQKWKSKGQESGWESALEATTISWAQWFEAT